jgi:hypothetical protein
LVSTNAIELKVAGKIYKPNNPLNVGIGFSLKNTIVNMRYDFGIVPLRGKEFGKTSLTDFQIHNYGQHVVLDLVIQKYKGFYYSNLKGTEVERYPGLSVSQIGAEGSYIFNGNKFSAKAAFEQSEKQLKSVGSFILGWGGYLFNIRPDNNMPIAGNGRIDNLQLGVNSGYGYSWVINDRWLMSGIATVGANFGNEPKLLKNGNIKVYPTAFARGVTSYHKADWAVAMLMLIHNKSVYTIDNENINLTSIDFELAYVRHLDRIFKRKNQ